MSGNSEMNNFIKNELNPFLKKNSSKKFNLNIDTKFEKISRGRKLDLIKLAKKNAEISLENNIQNEKRLAHILQKLKENLSLSSLPKRIECFDISNTQGTNPVASMVVFSNCEPDKSKYRKFKINCKGPNDCEMMKEAIQRRLKRIDQEGWEKPDLILIDGGKGHLNKISSLYQLKLLLFYYY